MQIPSRPGRSRPFLCLFLGTTVLHGSLLAAEPPVTLEKDAGLSVVAVPARIEAAPGALAEPISITVTNNSKWTTPITLKIESAMGWGGGAASTPEISPGGSVMITMFTRAPGMAGASLDTLVISAHADSDNAVRGFASVTAARRACIADWNGLAGPTIQDITDFLGDYFRQSADFNGVDGTTVLDLFDFIQAYFDGCK